MFFVFLAWQLSHCFLTGTGAVGRLGFKHCRKLGIHVCHSVWNTMGNIVSRYTCLQYLFGCCHGFWNFCLFVRFPAVISCYRQKFTKSVFWGLVFLVRV